MAYNIPKDYGYIPAYNPSIPRAFIRTHNHRRSRLEISNMFFRTKNMGADKNYFSIHGLSDRIIVKFNPPPFLSTTYPIEEILITNNNLADIRVAVNASSMLIEAMPPDVDIYDSRPSDVETLLDLSSEYVYSYSPFTETYMGGGDGLPLTPSGIISGPERSFVHINYGEDYTGNLSSLVNTMYEWVGASVESGMWKTYYKN